MKYTKRRRNDSTVRMANPQRTHVLGRGIFGVRQLGGWARAGGQGRVEVALQGRQARRGGGPRQGARAVAVSGRGRRDGAHDESQTTSPGGRGTGGCAGRAARRGWRPRAAAACMVISNYVRN